MDATITQLPTVPRTPFLDAQSFVAGDDDLVDDRHADEFCGLFQSLCDTDILIAGCGVAAGVDVDDQKQLAASRTEDFEEMAEAVSVRRGIAFRQ
jgi:hypothetical protein